jgi:lysophospholipid hydrolase
MAEVGSGGTLSSLFNILSLFTEDVHISWQDGEHETSGPSNALVPVFRSQPIRPPFAESDSEVSQFSLDPGPLRSSRRRDSVSTIQNVSPTHSRSTARPRAFDNGPISRATSLSAETSRTSRSADSRDSDSSPTETEQGTVARAVEDSTLAVIPAEAFRRLTKKFPKATAHIVQGGLLIRLWRHIGN